MPTYVEAARHVIERHRTYARDEYALKRAFELLEDVAVEALGMGYRPMHVLALLIQHGVGEVVVLVYDEVERIAFHPRLLLNDAQLASCIVCRFHFLYSRLNGYVPWQEWEPNPIGVILGS